MAKQVNGDPKSPVAIDAIIKAGLQNKKSNLPWWWRGTQCFAALMWVAWVTTVFLLMLGRLDSGWALPWVAVGIFFVLALMATFAGYQKENK